MRRWFYPFLTVALMATAMAQGTKENAQLTPEAWMLLGNEYYAEGAYDAALIAFKQAVEKEPQSSRALYGLGRVQLKLGLVNPAIENLKRAIALDAKFTPAYVALAEAYARLYVEADDRDAAKVHLARALSVLKDAERVSPNDPSVYTQEGLVYRLMDRGDRAVEAFQKALSLRPDDPLLLYNLAMAHLNMGKLDAAITALERAVKASPKDAYLRARYGALLAVRGDLKKAESVLADAVALDAKNALAWDYLGQVRLKQGDLEGAIEALEKTVDLRPLSYPEAYYYLGQAYLQKNDPEKARYYLTKAVVLAPESADYHYWLGVANERYGDLEGARAQYAEALKVNPQLTKAREALDRVKK